MRDVRENHGGSAGDLPPLYIDGLNVSKFDRDLFEKMREGGVTAANCTCCIWEDFDGVINKIIEWKRWFVNHSDLITPVLHAEDIRRANRDGKVGIILGWQNISGINDKLEYLALFQELGVRIIQLAYNTQNSVCSGCYESRDGGLSDFGREVIDEMNRLRLLCDLSHVGAHSGKDIIMYSKLPVAYTHCLPAALKSHPRNKTDEELRFIVNHGGFVGVTMFTPFLAAGVNATLDDYVGAIEYVVNVCGEDSVGIGTDFTEGHDEAFFEWISRDKGYGRRLTNLGEIKNPVGIESVSKFGAISSAMERRGWPKRRIDMVLGENWLKFLESVWGA